MNAISWIAISHRMICASRLREKKDASPTTTMTPQLIRTMARLVVMWLPAFAMDELLKAEPSALSMNGLNVATKWAFAARTYVNTTAMPMPATDPVTGETMRERYTYSPPARGIASSRWR